MASFNKVMVMGNLGAKPELRYTQNQTAVCTLSVATTDYKTGPDGQRQEFTEWHRIVVWGRQAENCDKFLDKGRSVLVEGRLQTRSWEDRQGQKRYTTEIVANNVQFVGGRDRSSGQSQYNQEEGGSSYSGGNSGGSSSNQNRGQPQPMEGDYGAPDTPGLDDIPF